MRAPFVAVGTHNDSLLKSVQQARDQLDQDQTDPSRSEKYVKALIRLNEFMIQEKVRLLASKNRTKGKSD